MPGSRVARGYARPYLTDVQESLFRAEELEVLHLLLEFRVVCVGELRQNHEEQQRRHEYQHGRVEEQIERSDLLTLLWIMDLIDICGFNVGQIFVGHA